ncbi:MAG: outer membrane beta-barrel protein [Acidobacteria bacterium]|nr:outer membrane beta-barrel protein [Acidobacteriota bacterium]
MLITTLFLALGIALPVSGQYFLAGLGGAAAVSNAAAVQSQPPAASNYDSKVGPACNVEFGRHLSDWISVQGGYIWNRNRIITSEVAGAVFRQSIETQSQHAVGADLMGYFRPRSSLLRPYLSVGPAWVRVLQQNKPGLRVAVGIDIRIGSGFAFRYSFSEMISGNPLALRLRPTVGGKLMNFQNLFGVAKVF